MDDLKAILNKSESFRKSTELSNLSKYMSAADMLSKATGLSAMSKYMSAADMLSKATGLSAMSKYMSAADVLSKATGLSAMSKYMSVADVLSKSMLVYDRLIYKNSTIEFPEIKEYFINGVPEVNEAILSNELVFEEIGNEISSSPAFKERKIQTQAILKMGDYDGNIALDYLVNEKTEAQLNKTITQVILNHINSVMNIPVVKIAKSVTTTTMAIMFWYSVLSPVFKGPASVSPFHEPQILPLFNEQVPAVTFFIGSRYYYEVPIIIGKDAIENPISNVASKDIEAKSADITEDK